MLPRAYGGDNHFPTGFDAVVHISAELRDLQDKQAVTRADTHKDNLVIENHCSVSSVDKGTGIEVTLFGEQGAFFQDRSDIPSPLTDLMLTCRQVAIDKTHRGIINNEPTDDGALGKREFRSIKGVGFPYLIPKITSHTTFDNIEVCILD